MYILRLQAECHNAWDRGTVGPRKERPLTGNFHLKSFTKEYVSTLKNRFSFGVPLNDVNDDAEIDFHT